MLKSVHPSLLDFPSVHTLFRWTESGRVWIRMLGLLLGTGMILGQRQNGLTGRESTFCAYENVSSLFGGNGVPVSDGNVSTPS